MCRPRLLITFPSSTIHSKGGEDTEFINECARALKALMNSQVRESPVPLSIIVYLYPRRENSLFPCLSSFSLYSPVSSR
jgi:hypothetical protein